ncbi:MAG: hypothetical protein H0V66_13875 [Bdellovibrionales bacterium]|nr:hypothetical protein [Bdellovibrionales bacterium]
MTLQEKTLQRYRQLFPNQPLREISACTGIQITRVFRLFNGKLMKVGELEAFEKAINDKIAENPSFEKLTSAVEEASTILTNDELAKVAEYIARKVSARTFGRFYIKPNYESAIIA